MLLFSDPPMYASTVMLRMFLGQPGSSLEVIYAGDRMWPALAHGQKVRTTPLESSTPPIGSIVVVEVDGVPDLLRIAGYEGESVLLRADSDPAPGLRVTADALLASVDLPIRPGAHRGAGRRRWMLDIHEAWTAQPDDASDLAKNGAGKVRPSSAILRCRGRSRYREYTSAAHPNAGAGGGEDPGDRVGNRSRGTRACRSGLASLRCGFLESDDGVCTEGGAAEKSGCPLLPAGSFLSTNEPDGSLSAVLFTYDVYSFLPDAAKRHRLLVNLARWLRPDGCVFLSARRPQAGLHYRMMLTLQWLRHGMKSGNWGCIAYTLDFSGWSIASLVRTGTYRGVDRL